MSYKSKWPSRPNSPIRNFFAAESKLNGRETRKLCNNTWLIRRATDVITLRLHNTDIATYFGPGHPYAGQIALSNGGWPTVTTKSRLNHFTPARISQKDFVWMEHSEDVPREFDNGMRIKQQADHNWTQIP